MPVCISHKQKPSRVLSNTLVHKAPETRRLNSVLLCCLPYGGMWMRMNCCSLEAPPTSLVTNCCFIRWKWNIVERSWAIWGK